MMINRYAFTVGDSGPVVAVAQQKRMAMKEQVTFYSDESRSVPLFSFQAQQRMDLGAAYDVMDASGSSVGYR